MACTRQALRLLFLMVALLVPSAARGGYDTWDTPNDGWFHDGRNWTDGSVPTAADTVEFGVAGTYQVGWNSVTGDWETQSMSLTGGDVTFRISDSHGSPYTWAITDVKDGADACIGGGTLRLGLTGDTANLVLEVDDELRVEEAGSLDVRLGNEVLSRTTTVGSTGDGTLAIHSAGRVYNAANGYVAAAEGSIGTVVVEGEDSLWQSAGNLYLGGTETEHGGEASLEVTSGGRVYVGDIDPATVGLGMASSGVVVSDGDGFGGELLLRNTTLSCDFAFLVGDNAGETGTVTVTGTSWMNVGHVIVGREGDGELTIAGGGSVSNYNGSVGCAPGGGSTGTVTVDGGTWTNNSDLYVGKYSEGELTIVGGGVVSSDDGYVAFSPGSTGTVTVDGGTWTNIGSVYVGYEGEGTVTIENGGSVSSTDAYVARYGAATGGATGSLTVTGEDSTWQSSGNLYVGRPETADGGGASLTVSDGGRVYVGDINPATVSLLSSQSAVVVSDNDTTGGELLLRNGATLSNDGHACLGFTFGERGTAIVTGAGTSWMNDADLMVGLFGEATLTVTGGGSVSGTNGFVGAETGSNGTVIVDGGTWTNDTNLTVGRFGEGTLTVTGGGTVSDIGAVVATYPGSTGTVTVDGGTWTNVVLTVGSQGEGAVTIENGGSVSSTDAYVARFGGATGSVTVTGEDSTWQSSGNLYVGGTATADGGDASLTVSDGGRVYVGDIDPATVTMDASSSAVVVSDGGSGGELLLRHGATLNSGNFSYLGYNAGETGTVMVAGAGTSWTTVTLAVGYCGEGTLTVTDGGTVANVQGTVGWVAGSTGAVIVDGGTWTNSGDLSIGGPIVGPGGTGAVTVFPGGLLEIADMLWLWPAGTLTLAGGTVRFGAADPLDDQGGTLNYLAGTVEFDCDVTVLEGLSGVTDFFGSSPTIPGGKHLDVNGQATLVLPVTLGGGTFSAGSIANSTLLDFQSGTFNLTDDDLVVGPGGLFGSTLTLPADKAVNVTHNAVIEPFAELALSGGTFTAGSLTNSGLIHGDGRIGGPLTNAAAGEVRAESGQRLVFTATGNTNAGEIKLLGGIVEFEEDLTNAPTGFISGRGVLDVAGGLTNEGAMALSGGFTDIYGDVTNDPAGQIVISGGSTTTFYDDVASDGEIRVSADCSAVFFGAFTGTGGTTGTGTVYIEGDLRPGHSPSEVAFGGDVVFGPAAVLEVELGGTAPGASDAVHVADTVTLAGTLAVDLIAPFRPAHNDTFQVMTFASLGGTTFDSHEGLDLGDRLTLSPEYGETDLVLVAVQGGPGEWAVDADGNASVPANWSAGLPGGVGDVATFGSIITAPRDVIVDVPTVLGGLVFDSAEAYALAGPNPLTFDTDTGMAAITVANLAATHTIGADVLLADAVAIDVGELGTLIFEGLLDSGAGPALTKTGDGLLVIDGPQDHAPGTVFEILAGTVDLNTDASGTGLMDDADLSILVADATLNFGCNQHLDTLEIGDGGLVRFTGANVVVVKHLVMDGIDLGAMTLAPEPATLALLALGGLGALLKRRAA